jgi:hypothetical protein
MDLELDGKQSATDADMKQAITFWELYCASISTWGYKLWCHHGTNADMSMTTSWSSDVYHHYLHAMHTLSSEKSSLV